MSFYCLAHQSTNPISAQPTVLKTLLMAPSWTLVFLVASPNTVADTGPIAKEVADPSVFQNRIEECCTNTWLELEASYLVDVFSNVEGGIRPGTKYVDQALAAATVHFGDESPYKIQTSILYNNGSRLSEDLVGDAQIVSNIEAPVNAVRLYESWLEGTAFEQDLSVRLGLYDINSEFDALEASSGFIGSGHGIGTDVGQTGLNGPSIFPFTSLGVRAQYSPSENLQVRMAILDGVPGDPDAPEKTTVSISKDDGAFIIGEVDYSPEAGSRLLFGHWRYSSRFDQFSGKSSTDNSGWYVRGEKCFELDVDECGGTSIFFRLGISEPSVNMFGKFASAGLWQRSILDRDGRDALGIAVAWAETSKEYRSTIEQADRREIAIEATYRYEFNDQFFVQPNIQYVVNPGANSALSNALVVGVRTGFSFSRS